MSGSSLSFPQPATLDFILVSSSKSRLARRTAIFRLDILLTNICVSSVSGIRESSSNSRPTGGASMQLCDVLGGLICSVPMAVADVDGEDRVGVRLLWQGTAVGVEAFFAACVAISLAR